MRKSIKSTSSDTFDRKRRHKKRLFLWVYIFIGFFVLLGFLSNLPGMRVELGAVSGNNYLASNEIAENFEEYVHGRIFYTKSNSLLFRKGKYRKHLEESFPNLDTVVVKRASLKKLSVTVTEFNTQYYWCSDDCYALNNSFEAIEKVTSLDENYPKFISDDITISISEVPDNAEDLKMVAAGYRSLLDVGVQVWSIERVSEKQYRYLLGTENAERLPYIAVHAEQSQSAFDLSVRALSTDTDNRYILYENLEELEYIDLRFKNRIIYKQRNEDTNQENQIDISKEPELEESN
jgi:hypothetical protein